MCPLDAEERDKERRKGEEWGVYKRKLDEVDVDLKKLIDSHQGLREVFDKIYAVKLVEKLVFGLVGLVCIAIIGALLKLVVIK